VISEDESVENQTIRARLMTVEEGYIVGAIVDDKV
jgi:hypothetical protein